jgi:myo-inositol-1(or 4)-monophosphatase
MTATANLPNRSELDHALAVAIQAARAGGEVIRAGALRRSSLTVERKKVNDFVSAIDRGSERAILDILSAGLPGHAVRAEESGDSKDARSAEFLWLIDPLDGTTNFLQGIPHYCVSMGLQVHGEVMVAVILDPIHDRLFTATRGGGAWLNGSRIVVSGRSGLTEGVIGTGLPFNDWSYLDDYLASLRVIMQRCAGIRRAGAAALDLAYVAAGWLDGYWEKGLHPWDVGAGSLLVQEAGGVVTDFAGSPRFIENRHVVAGPPAVHGALTEILRGYPTLLQTLNP